MSIQRILIRFMLRRQIKARFSKTPDMMVLRAVMDEAQKLAKPVPAPFVHRHDNLAGVPTDTITPPAAPTDSAVIHIHGGGFVGGGAKNYWGMGWRMAQKTGRMIFLPEYRLAPEHPYPAGLDDLDGFYDAVLARGIQPDKLVVSGDSAGGNLALALMHRLKQRGAPLPAGLICLSPVTSLVRFDGSLVSNVGSDDLFSDGGIGSTIAHYCKDRDLNDPCISPLSGDVSGFPPTLFHAAESEMLRDQTIWMADALRAAGIAVDIKIEKKLWHVWHAFADTLPEARASIDELAAFARRCIAA